MNEVIYITAPREGVNDDYLRLVEWRVEDGARVASDQVVAIVETTKAAIEVSVPCAGYLFRLVDVGSEVAVGSPLAVVTARADRSLQRGETTPACTTTTAGTTVVTAKARPLMERHGLTATDFPALRVVRTSDVEQLLASKLEADRPARQPRFRDELLDPAIDWDEVVGSSDARDLSALLEAMRRRMKARFNRHVPTGSLLHDRWQLARDHGFGEASSVYDECLILGEVTVGANCWIGPFTVLDGQGGLTIGDYVDIGAGAHLYSHNTIERALTGHVGQLYRKATKIGSCCFIAPHAMIGPGTVLGDRCFVAAGSYVEGVFPDGSYIAGNPARIVGRVEVRGGRAHLQRSEDGWFKGPSSVSKG